MNDKPTPDQFNAYQAQFDYLNKTLFGGTLPPALLNFSRKTSRTLSFFAAGRWSAGEVKAHEISLNPVTLKNRTPSQVAATLAHEMVHLWQEESGTAPKHAYHNKGWAAKMEEIGLMPSTTGAPGGKKTGPRCSHYVIEGGIFEKAFNEMPKELHLPWVCCPENHERAKAKQKIKYACDCGLNVWGKPGISVRCDECDVIMTPEEK